MATSYTINTTSECPLNTMLNLEGVQSKLSDPCVMEKRPTTNYPMMNATADRDDMLTKCLETQERLTLRRQARQSLNGWRRQGVRQTGKKHQREWCERKGKSKELGLYFATPSHSFVLRTSLFYTIWDSHVAHTRRGECTLPELFHCGRQRSKHIM